MLLEARIKGLALANGYDLCGIAPPRLGDQEQEELREFVAAGRAGGMSWFDQSLELRLDPQRVFPGVKSILMLGVVYRSEPSEELLRRSRVRVSRYAQGRDYHRLLRKRGRQLLQRIRELVPQANGRVTVDSAPVSEKSLARYAGLGWLGKHTNLIHPKLGSYFFLSALLLDINLERDQPMRDRCGECRLCIDACPTEALTAYRMDARKCLSYATIECRDGYPQELAGKSAGWAFGCDICQEVCPYNKPVDSLPRLKGDRAFLPADWVRDLMIQGTVPDEETWERESAGSPLRRAGRSRMLENVREARS